MGSRDLHTYQPSRGQEHAQKDQGAAGEQQGSGESRTQQQLPEDVEQFLTSGGSNCFIARVDKLKAAMYVEIHLLLCCRAMKRDCTCAVVLFLSWRPAGCQEQSSASETCVSGICMLHVIPTCTSIPVIPGT